MNPDTPILPALAGGNDHEAAFRQRAPAVPVAPSAPASSFHNVPINILIVDDEPKNLTVLEVVLDDPSYRLVRASSAEKALLELVVDEFALLILDIKMPGMTGFELAQMIKKREKTAGVPIIFLTAYYNEDQHMLEGYVTGAVDYLLKPVNAAVLRSKVAVFAELYRKNRECGMVNRALLTEVTERRRAEDQLRELNETLEQRVNERTEALRQSQSRLRHAADAARLTYVEMDFAHGGARTAENFAAVMGYAAPPAEIDDVSVSSRLLIEHVVPHDRQRVEAALQEFFSGKPFGRIDYRVLGDDQIERWIESKWSIELSADSKPLKMFATNLDITARKRAEEAQRHSEEQVRLALESAELGSWNIDLATGVLVSDERFRTIFGATIEDLTYEQAFAIIHPDDRLRIREAVAAASRPADPVPYEVEYRVVLPDGSLRWVFAKGRANPSGLGPEQTLLSLYGTVADITDRKRVETLLAAQKKVLELAASGTALKDILQFVVRSVQQHSGEQSRASLFLLEPDGLHLRFAVAEGLSEDYTRAIDQFEVGLHSPSCGTAAFTGQRVICGDVTKDPLWEPFLSLAKEHGIRAVWSQPLRTLGGKVLGTLAMYHRTPREPEPGELEAAEILSQTAALVIERNRESEQREHAEIALRESEERFRGTFENAAIGIAHVGLDGRWLRVNRALCQITGYSSEELATTTFAGITHPDDADASLAQVRRLLAGELATYTAERRYIRKDDSQVWVNLSVSLLRDTAGQPRHFIAAVEDISAKKATLEELDRQRRFIERLTEVMPSVLYVYDPAERRNIWFNRTIATVVGYSPDQVQAMGSVVMPALMHPEDLPSFEQHMTRVAALGDNEIVGFEYRIRDAAGQWHWFHSRNAVFARDAAGGAQLIIGTTIEISDRKHAEEDLRRANKDLEQFAFSASHDLQEPLRNIAIFSQLLKKQYGNRLDAQADEFLNFIVEGAQHMGSLVSDLLTYTQAASLEREQVTPVAAGNVFEQVLKGLDRALQERHGTVTSGPLPSVPVKEIHLHQLLQNLIGNALKYCKDDEPPRVHVSAMRQESHWRFSVQDNGIGVAPEHQVQVFGIFKRLHGNGGKYSGTGIGLAICEKIVDRYRGRIWMESELGQGSTFHFTLPAAGSDFNE